MVASVASVDGYVPGPAPACTTEWIDFECDGDIPLARILGQLVDAGYAGCFDLELIGPAIESEGYESAIPRSVTQLRELLASLS